MDLEVFAGGGVGNFYFAGGGYIVGEGGNFVGGPHNFEVKTKIT